MRQVRPVAFLVSHRISNDDNLEYIIKSVGWSITILIFILSGGDFFVLSETQTGQLPLVLLQSLFF